VTFLPDSIKLKDDGLGLRGGLVRQVPMTVQFADGRNLGRPASSSDR
jgi:hypothetical protein